MQLTVKYHILRVLQVLCNPRWLLYLTIGFWQRLFNYKQKRQKEYSQYLCTVEEAISRTTSRQKEEINVIKDFSLQGASHSSVNHDATKELLQVVYGIVLFTKPDVVVETGVANGMTSYAILSAFHLNRGNGYLYSIDLPASIERLKKHTGNFVPLWMRSRWSLMFGSSTQQLPRLMDKLQRVDLFIHDSNHTYQCQRMEYETVWPYLSFGGMLISDDINNDALFEVAEKYRAAPLIVKQAKIFPIGILVKTKAL